MDNERVIVTDVYTKDISLTTDDTTRKRLTLKQDKLI